MVKAADVARLTKEAFDKERAKMLADLPQCHSARLREERAQKGDDMVREADHLMAQAIRDRGRALPGRHRAEAQGGLPTPSPTSSPSTTPPTVVEQKLFVMFLEHRMRTFQGAFHNNPDYALWYGWSEMQRDLTEIRALDKEMRHAAATREEGPARGEEVVTGEETAMDAIELLMQEHQLILRSLDALDAFTVDMARGGDDRDELSRFVRFIREFADARHHGKEEDILFEAMVAAGFPREGGPIAVMLMDHEAGRAHVGVMAATAEQAEPWTAQDSRGGDRGGPRLRRACCAATSARRTTSSTRWPGSASTRRPCAGWTRTAPPSRSGRSRRGATR